MTSDAKIGLLLGLVFIFVIAFVINGLPSFKDATNTSELTTNMVRHESQPMGTNERKVQEGFDWAGKLIEAVEIEIPSPPVEEKTEDVRFEMPIPKGIAVVEESSIQITPELIEQTLAQSSNPEVARDLAAEALAATPNETIVIELPPVEKKTKPKKTRRAIPKVYVAANGDTLSSISKKVYGPVEGNRLVNVQAIFEANRKTLKSIDDVVVGQELIVPPLKKAKPHENKPESLLVKSLFEEARQIGRRLLSGDKPKPRAKPSTQYIVKDGDNLWRVAAAQLGSSIRYKEIVKLNPSVLADENTTLDIGMHLTLPAQ